MPKPSIRPLGTQEDVSMEGTLSPQSLSQMRSEVRRKRANRDWLDSHRDELRARYADKYVAVVDGAVIGDSEKVGSVEVLYFAPQKETRTRSRAAGLRLERRERSFVVPSLLGTDVLRANRCVLEVD